MSDHRYVRLVTWTRWGLGWGMFLSVWRCWGVRGFKCMGCWGGGGGGGVEGVSVWGTGNHQVSMRVEKQNVCSLRLSQGHPRPVLNFKFLIS